MKYKNFNEYAQSDEYLIVVLGQTATFVVFEDNSFFSSRTETEHFYASFHRGRLPAPGGFLYGRQERLLVPSEIAYSESELRRFYECQ